MIQVLDSELTGNRLLPTGAIIKAKFRIVLSGQTVIACHYPVGSADYCTWMLQDNIVLHSPMYAQTEEEGSYKYLQRVKDLLCEVLGGDDVLCETWAPCAGCGKVFELRFMGLGYLRVASGWHMKYAMPELSADEIIFMTTRHCCKCFEELFKKP